MSQELDLSSVTLIRPKQLVILLDISKATLWRWIRDGIWPEPIRIYGVTGWTLETVQTEISKRESRAPIVSANRPHSATTGR